MVLLIYSTCTMSKPCTHNMFTSFRGTHCFISSMFYDPHKHTATIIVITSYKPCHGEGDLLMNSINPWAALVCNCLVVMLLNSKSDSKSVIRLSYNLNKTRQTVY